MADPLRESLLEQLRIARSVYLALHDAKISKWTERKQRLHRQKMNHAAEDFHLALGLLGFGK